MKVTNPKTEVMTLKQVWSPIRKIILEFGLKNNLWLNALSSVSTRVVGPLLSSRQETLFVHMYACVFVMIFKLFLKRVLYISN